MVVKAREHSSECRPLPISSQLVISSLLLVSRPIPPENFVNIYPQLFDGRHNLDGSTAVLNIEFGASLP